MAGVRPVLDQRLVEVRSQSVPEATASASTAPQLTARQREVLDLVAAGTTSNKDLAKELFISEKTVKSHIERIAASLDVSRRAQLPLRALELGLLPVPDRPAGSNSRRAGRHIDGGIRQDGVALSY
jgi:DNA-binding NarL/FixJ family response regulator